MLERFHRASQLPEQPEIVIVGAGAVGLTLAVHLSRSGKKVLLLEAGGQTPEGVSQSFFQSAASIGHRLRGLHDARFRALGGTTNAWGGQLVPLDAIVFEEREQVPGGAWPITRGELDCAYELAFDLFGMPKRLEDEALWRRLNITLPETGNDLEFFLTRWTPNPNFAHLFRKDLVENPNLRVLMNAPVTGLWTGVDGKRVGVTIASPDGERHDLAAGRVILAQGTVEIARLLSMPPSNAGTAPWADNPWLGRGFCDHVDAYAGNVTLIDPDRFHQLFDAAFIKGLKYLPKLKLSENAQRKYKLLGIAGHFVFASRNEQGLKATKSLIRGVLNGRFDAELVQSWRSILTVPKSAIPVAAHYLRHRRIYNPGDLGIQLRLTGEQVPLRESGLRLTDKKDALGMPGVEMDWRIDGVELETMAVFSALTAEFLERERLAKIEIDPRLLDRDPEFLNQIEDGYHHMGMARMGSSPEDGVVDSDLKVFGTENLFVAGAATFRSTGFPNPTLTAIALGLRLGEAILEERC